MGAHDALLVRQLRLRFGDLASDLEQRVRRASVDDLDAMAERVLTARTPGEVIG